MPLWLSHEWDRGGKTDTPKIHIGVVEMGYPVSPVGQAAGSESGQGPAAGQLLERRMWIYGGTPNED